MRIIYAQILEENLKNDFKSYMILNSLELRNENIIKIEIADFTNSGKTFDKALTKKLALNAPPARRK